MALTAQRMQVPADPADFFEWALANGWSDGLPCIPPTPERVAAMVEGSGRKGDEVIAAVDPRKGIATVEKIAVNAVMAGCEPAYMPVLIAAVEAMTDPELNLHGMQCTTNPGGPIFVVNGPARDRLEIAYAADAAGPGHRANQTIGRAIRLIMRNIGGGIPPTDRATFGSPWKMGCVFGENEELSPWEPMHVEKRFDAGDSVVTAFNAESIINIAAVYRSAEALLVSFANAMRIGLNINFSDGTLAWALSGGHARILAEAGFSKQQVKEELFERAKVPLESFPPEGNIPMGHWTEDAGRVLVTRSPADIELIVAGDDPPYHSIYFVGWALSRTASRAVVWPGQ
jgi:hypothetical protein